MLIAKGSSDARPCSVFDDATVCGLDMLSDAQLVDARLYALAGTLNEKEFAAASQRASSLPKSWAQSLPASDFTCVYSALKNL